MNIYWPVYKNLESEFLRIMYYVHIDDNQLSVHSSKIADLILRAAVEIESISKELYIINGGKKRKIRRFDDEILDDVLIPDWTLDKKVVFISSHNCFQTQREMFPFQKTENKTLRPAELTFSWNNAYQNLKHDRGKSLPFGSIKYLFDIMAALYILNIYYKNDEFPEGKFHNEVPIHKSLDSDIFSINIHHVVRTEGGTATPKINDDFYKSVYYTDITEKSSEKFNKSVLQNQIQAFQCALKYPEAKEIIKKNMKATDPSKLLGMELWTKGLRDAIKIAPPAFFEQRFKATLNKGIPPEWTYQPDQGAITDITETINQIFNS